MQISHHELNPITSNTIIISSSNQTCKTCSSTESCPHVEEPVVGLDSIEPEPEPEPDRESGRRDEDDRVVEEPDTVTAGLIPSPVSAVDVVTPFPTKETTTISKSKAKTNSLAYNYPAAPPSYPVLTPTLHSSPIEILATPEKGRGVYATKDIPVGVTIDISPVLLISDSEYYGGGSAGDGKGVEGSVLRGYVFTWRGREGVMALALGMGSIFNHSITPNVSFELNTTLYTIHYKTFRPVLAGQELCIFYGHKTMFEGAEQDALSDSDADDESGWGGLGDVVTLGDGSKKAKDRAQRIKNWEQEIIPWEELGWRKVTSVVDPEDQVLTTVDCWIIDIPARNAQLAFAFTKLYHPGHGNFPHLKRVRKLPDLSPEGELMISVLLFPVSTSPADVASLITDSPLAPLAPKLYQLPIPTTIARTETQAKEWGELWPLHVVKIREGPMALSRVKGWERAKRDWVDKEVKKVWRAAKESGDRGEHPIACHVSESFNMAINSSTVQPRSIARAHDTRISTRNVLSHAASNAIDAVAILDRQNLRETPLIPDAPAPYLLTGLTVFLSHEPCLLCAMSLLHSRIKELFYVRRAPGSGGCGSCYEVHENEGLNHKFDVWEWVGGELGEEIPELALDT